jgi:hypothetical protein
MKIEIEIPDELMASVQEGAGQWQLTVEQFIQSAAINQIVCWRGQSVPPNDALPGYARETILLASGMVVRLERMKDDCADLGELFKKCPPPWSAEHGATVTASRLIDWNGDDILTMLPAGKVYIDPTALRKIADELAEHFNRLAQTVQS